MPLDTNVFDKIKTFADYQKADQAFQLQKAVQAQALQTGGIDAASKANVYKTQLLSGAVAGGQGAYDTARAKLAEQGIDTSEYAPDVNMASQQLQQARLAQSPLGSLLNAGSKLDSNANTVSLAGGKVPSDPNATTHAILSGGINSIVPGASGIISAPSAPSSSAPPPSTSVMPPNVAGNIQATLNPSGADVPPVNIADSTSGRNLTPSGALPGTEVASFSFRPQRPDETIAAYKDAQQQAFEAYKSDPNYIAKVKGAETAGKLEVENAEQAKKADELTKRLGMNLDAMLKINPDVPYSGILPASVDVYKSQALAAHPSLNAIAGDNGVAATAANQWDQINNQQILSEIQQFIASGGANVRTNQTLERIVKAASGINRNDLPASREAQIKTALAEIANKNVSAQNLAGGKQPYNPIPVVTSAGSAPGNGWSIQKVQ